MADAGAIHLEMLELFDRHDLVRLRETLHPDYSYRGPDAVERKGPEAGMAVVAGALAAFPDLRVAVDHHYCFDDISVVEFTVRGTHLGPLGHIPASGKSYELVQCAVVEVRDNKIYREREYYDLRNLRKQLGVD